MRILYLMSSLSFSRLPSRFTYLSRTMDGDVVIAWNEEETFETNNLIQFHKNQTPFGIHVEYHKSFYDRTRFFVQTGSQLANKHKYDVIITYNAQSTGIAGYILKKKLRVPLICEIMNEGSIKSFLYQSQTLSWKTISKALFSKILMHYVITQSDHVHLLYPQQVTTGKPTSVFHDFTFTDLPLTELQQREKTILFLGFPWYLKGVDILIKAFNLISNNFPEYTLKIVGHCPDKSYFNNLANNNERIQLLDAVYQERALDLLQKSSLFVLPSRTEAMGRVILEAMSLGTPVIASNVGGIPQIINSGVNGLLFESENINDLSNKMSTLLENESLRSKMAFNALKDVKGSLSIKSYIDHFTNMVKGVSK